MNNRILIRIAKILGWFAGIWIVIIAALEIFLTSSALTGIVNKVAAEFIDGSISFGKIELSMFRHFPSASISLEDFSITYPANRYDADEAQGPQGWLLRQGCGEVCDTLASFDRFTASINVSSLLAGRIRIPRMELSAPEIYAHNYGDGRANWNIFRMEKESDSANSTGTGIPDLMLGRVRLNGNPRIVYTDSKDTVFTMINLKDLDFRGRLDTHKPGRSRISLRVDSLFAAGRLGRDTLAFGLNHLGISEKDRKIRLHASANAFSATRALGRLFIPIDIKGEATIPGRSDKRLKINSLSATIADLPVKASGELEFLDDRLGMDVEAAIEKCHLNDLLKGIAINLVPDSRKISTDAVLNFRAKAEGEYVFNEGSMPHITASLHIPQSTVAYKDFPAKIGVGISAGAETDADGRLNVRISQAGIGTTGLTAEVKGTVSDILNADPCVGVDGRIDVVLDSIASLIPDTLHVNATGQIEARINGNIRVSQMDPHRFSQADIKGEVRTEGIRISSPPNRFKAHIGKTDISLRPEDKTSQRTGETFRMLALKATVDTTSITAGGAKILGEELSFSAMNSTDGQEAADSGAVRRFGGHFRTERLFFSDQTGLTVGVRQSSNGFQILPKRDDPKTPVLTLTSHNKSLFLKNDLNRIIVNNAVIGADATMQSKERRQRSKAARDSMILAGRQRNIIPSWMKEDDFRNKDIDFRLDETVARYFREWNINGMLSLGGGLLITPYFPLRNALQGFEGHFNNNQIRIDRLEIKTGESELSAKGSLNGIRRILSGRGRNLLDLKLDITSDKINANELLRAYSAGTSFDSGSLGANIAQASDEDFLEIVTTDTSSVSETGTPLIVVPANLNADIKLNAGNITYSDLAIDRLNANIVMKERCIQVTDTYAASNIGGISFDGFYATRNKQDIQTGFNFNFKDITAERVISLIPAVDTLMPVLKSFQGKLNCEMAATARLDTNMNINIPSIKGIMRITGDDLTIKDNPMFRTLAKKLLFKNKKEGHIEHMSVEGIISDSTVEIFPFIINMDRYTLALSGVQRLDMSFKYHASLIKSPFLFKLGVDVFGDNFDNWKFKIGKPKYKNAEVPVFSSVIDQTKINLTNTIEGIFRKGLDAAVRENPLDAVENHRKELNYVRAVDQKLEELSEEEQRQLAAEEAAENGGDGTEGSGDAVEGSGNGSSGNAVEGPGNAVEGSGNAGEGSGDAGEGSGDGTKTEEIDK